MRHEWTWRHEWAWRTGLTAAALTLAVTGASAQQRIGEAAAVQNQVTRVSAGGSAGLAVGGSVFRDETVRTAPASSARLVFLDQTNLAIGPSSSVVLNRFVYAGGAGTQAMSVNLARGAFRFTTGALDKSAYKINTPVATIGVRGTVLDIFSERGRTRVTLVDNGAALACASSGAGCVELLSPGDSVEITSAGARRVGAGRPRFSFNAYCSTPGLCGATQLAAAPDLSPPGDALCGR